MPQKTMPISLSDRQLIILPFFENIFNNKHGSLLVFGPSPNGRASGHARTPDCAAARLTAIHSLGHELSSENMYDKGSARLGACSTPPALSLLTAFITVFYTFCMNRYIIVYGKKHFL